MYLLDELNKIPALPEKRPNELTPNKGAVTAYTAYHLKAKIFSDLAGNNNNSLYLDSMLTTTNIIINSGKFELHQDYYELFKIDGKLCNESLYEMQYTDFGAGSGNLVHPGTWFQFQGPRGGMIGGHGPNQGVSFGCSGFMIPSHAYIDFLASREDTFRSRTTVISLITYNEASEQYGITNYGDTMKSVDGIQYTNGKFYTPSQQITVGRIDYGLGNNIRVLRYADVLLLNAEALVRKGKNGDKSFNLVRSRAKLSPITGVTLLQILDERRAEFMGEWGEQFFDSVRTGRATSLLPKYTEDTRYYPLPQNEIDINDNLTKYAYPFIPPQLLKFMKILYYLIVVLWGYASLWAQTDSTKFVLQHGKVSDYCISIVSSSILKGKVIDEYRNPLSNVLVMVKNSPISCSTDTMGIFQFEVSVQDKFLQFYYPKKIFLEIPFCRYNCIQKLM
ncbi:MAG: RagB/SusD family nutrient uptake outer membrane protein [Chitinophagaceae bacterium]